MLNKGFIYIIFLLLFTILGTLTVGIGDVAYRYSRYNEMMSILQIIDKFFVESQPCMQAEMDKLKLNSEMTLGDLRTALVVLNAQMFIGYFKALYHEPIMKLINNTSIIDVDILEQYVWPDIAILQLSMCKAYDEFFSLSKEPACKPIQRLVLSCAWCVDNPFENK